MEANVGESEALFYDYELFYDNGQFRKKNIIVVMASNFVHKSYLFHSGFLKISMSSYSHFIVGVIRLFCFPILIFYTFSPFHQFKYLCRFTSQERKRSLFHYILPSFAYSTFRVLNSLSPLRICIPILSYSFFVSPLFSFPYPFISKEHELLICPALKALYVQFLSTNIYDFRTCSMFCVCVLYIGNIRFRE